MSEWEETILGEILELITDYHANGSYETLKENVELLERKDFAIMIRTTNFEQNDFSINLKYINEDAYYFLKKSTVYPGDIIMNKIANAGSVYFMPNLYRPVSLAMNLFLLRVNRQKANQHFIFYYLKINESYVKQFAEGSVTKTITKNAVRNLVIRKPSIEKQNSIVRVIESIENKIDNLRRQNETLEEIARSIFKHWFIDFEFPNPDGKPYKSSGGACHFCDEYKYL
jgi:type I restriction enzyme, S subunit